MLLAPAPDTKQLNDTLASQTETLNHRLFLFWNGSWDTLVSEAPPPNATQTSSLDDAQTAARVENLTSQSETGRATSTLTAPPKFTTNPADLPPLRALFKWSRQQKPPDHAPTPPPPNNRDTLLPTLTKQLRHYPRNKKPGPDGSRNEHWATLAHDDKALRSLSVIATRLQHGHAPSPALDAALTTQLGAKLKPNGGLRPLAVGTGIRRITATAIHRTHKAQIQHAVGKQQYGVGRPNGPDTMYKII